MTRQRDPSSDRQIEQLKSVIDKQKVTLQQMNTKIQDNEQLLVNKQKEIKDLKSSLDGQLDSLLQTQLHVEQLDNASRNRGLLITGVQEEESIRDSDQVAEILRTRCNTKVSFAARRIGQNRGERPILVTVLNKTIRNNIHHQSKMTADMDSSVRIMKDYNPVYRAEWRRLYEVQRRLKREQPEANVEFDKERRRLFVDGTLTDWWKPKIINLY